MNWVYSVAAVVVAVGIVTRLLWWAYDRSHQLANQRQNSTENPTEMCETGHKAEEKNAK
jgi:hypothetical protein